MNHRAKIHLSNLEIDLVNNKEWIFTKQKIIEKLYNLFGELHDEYRRIIEDQLEFLPAVFKRPGGKISKGENYNGLPYLILDYPAMFGKENIFAIRTMFWWGNFFSTSLHLSGNYVKQDHIYEWLSYFREKDFFVCVSETEWEHDFHSMNFIDIKTLNEKQAALLTEKDFFKVAKKIELHQWDETPELLKRSFKEILNFVRISFPAGETIP